jgi:alpha-N-arabinofuranosidase
LRDALLAALNLDIFARHADRVRMANIAQMINVMQSMIMTDRERMVLTPTYHVFRMYAPFQDATFVPVQVDAGVYTQGKFNLPRIDAIAARDARGNLWLAAVNLDPRQTVRIHPNFANALVRSAHGQVLTAGRVDAINSFESPHTVEPTSIDGVATADGLVLELPPKSVSVVQLSR